MSVVTTLPNVSSIETAGEAEKFVPSLTFPTGGVVKTSLFAPAGLTVSTCVAEVRTAAASAAVIVGPPATVSLYSKLALDAPGPIVTVVIVAASVESRKTAPVELVERLTVVVPTVVGVPEASSRCTMIEPLVTPAVEVCGAVVKASFVASPVTVTGPPAELVAVHEL